MMGPSKPLCKRMSSLQGGGKTGGLVDARRREGSVAQGVRVAGGIDGRWWQDAVSHIGRGSVSELDCSSSDANGLQRANVYRLKVALLFGQHG